MNRSIRFTNRTSNGRKRAVPCTIAGRPRRSAFTLVELLVVITIIGMLTGLLLPAVNMAREAGRRATCTNNQHQISLAMMNFESARRYFPGYIGYVGSNGYPVSWVVSVFPYLERTDLYNIWANGIEVTPGTITYPQPGWGSSSPIPTTSPNSVLYENAYKYNSILVCPSDPPPSKGNNETWLSYVCNRGVNHRTDIANDTRFNDDFPVPNSSVALGICMDFAPYANWQGGIMNMIGLDYITGHDGAAFTLILSESLFSDPGTQPMYLFESGNSSQSNVRSNPRWTCAQGASEKTQVNLGFEWGPANWADGAVGTKKLSDKIRSRHPGGVVASFCDGHQQFLREDMDINVYKHLMTPWSAGCPGYRAVSPSTPTNTANSNPNPLAPYGTFDEASL